MHVIDSQLSARHGAAVDACLPRYLAIQVPFGQGVSKGLSYVTTYLCVPEAISLVLTGLCYARLPKSRLPSLRLRVDCLC